jgi:hypothetical protein
MARERECELAMELLACTFLPGRVVDANGDSFEMWPDKLYLNEIVRLADNLKLPLVLVDARRSKRPEEMPFFDNPDNNHCLEACLGTIIEYQTGNKLTDDELEQITGKVEGEYSGTWLAFTNLNKLGFEITTIGGFDHKKFGESGYAYVREFLGEDIANQWRGVVNLEREQLCAKEASAVVNTETRRPTIEDIKRLVDGGKTTIAYVNGLALSGMEGFRGHFVTIIGYEPITGKVIIHNPGFLGGPNQSISYKHFEKAWYDPNPKTASLIIIERKK